MRVFPLSNWTELDVWEYVLANIPVVPLYFAKDARSSSARARDHGRRRPAAAAARRGAGDAPVRFRTLGCYPLTGAVESDAVTLDAIIGEMLLTRRPRNARDADRPRPIRVDGEKEAGRLFLMNERFVAQTDAAAHAAPS